jgi:hypothetical protein
MAVGKALLVDRLQAERNLAGGANFAPSGWEKCG